MDREAEEDFRAFVHGAYRRLLRTGYLLTGDRHRAEDLVQVTLARAALAWHRIGRAEAVDAYVRRIMVNASTSLWRRRRWREQLTSEPPDPPDRPAGGDPYATLDERDRLRRALAALPARQRAAVVLRHYEDLTEQQAAAALGCPVGTVKSLTSRGLTRLRAEFAGPELAGPELAGPELAGSELAGPELAGSELGGGIAGRRGAAGPDQQPLTAPGTAHHGKGARR